MNDINHDLSVFKTEEMHKQFCEFLEKFRKSPKSKSELNKLKVLNKYYSYQNYLDELSLLESKTSKLNFELKISFISILSLLDVKMSEI